MLLKTLALHPPPNEKLDQAWNNFAADPGVWVAILTGAGDKTFVVAAVNAVALGGGPQRAPACDVIVAAERARFRSPEPRAGLMA